MYTTVKLLTVSYMMAILNLSAQPCGPEGRGNTPLDDHEKHLNRGKNKSSAVPKKDPEVISIEALKDGRAPKKDADAWWEGAYVEINDAYLVTAEEQGPETCNCGLADERKKDGDVHINIGNKRDLKDKNNNYYVVVEITPSYKKLHPNYEQVLNSLKDKRVTVRGYLLYDYKHEGNSINYCGACTDRGVWRKTCWEVHPVTFVAAYKP